MTGAELRSIIQAGEGYHTEFKQSLDKSFVEEACAFANSGGGKILLGITDDGTIKGIDTGNSCRSRVQDTLSQIQPNLEVEVRPQDGILIVTIPEGMEKPYGCSKGFFMRMGANSQKLERDQIIEFFKKEGRIRFDELRHQKADFHADFDPHAFSRFLGLAGISTAIDQKRLLRNLDCLTEDDSMTNAGVLLFARDIDFLLNHAMVVCVLYKGTSKVDILDKKDFTGNLVDNIENAMLFVKRHTNVALKIERLQHEKITDYPEVALREAIINAVCHRDYFDKRANVVVEVFEDRVVITNPGGLPSGLSPEEFGTKSVARNPLLASLLHRIDYIEKVGTGIERIRRAVATHLGCTLDIHYDDFYTVTFIAKSRLESATTDPGPAQVAGKVIAQVGTKLALSRHQVVVLRKCRTDSALVDLMAAVGRSDRTKFRHQVLNSMLEAGLVERTIPGKPRSSKQKYRLTERGRQAVKS